MNEQDLLAQRVLADQQRKADKKGRTDVTQVKLAGEVGGKEYAVMNMTSKKEDCHYRTEPCPQCPWRPDQNGKFPPDAFRHSANTAYENSLNIFACHMSDPTTPTTCAGFLLRGADHNQAVKRLHALALDISAVTDNGHELHSSYRAMAEANGVDSQDPVLAPCLDPIK